MPKKLANNLADRLEVEIRRHPDGAAPGVLVRAFANDASARSLGRLLKHLERRQRIRAQGKGRATRYFSIAQAKVIAQAPLPLLAAEGEVYVPLTGDSEELRAWIRRPITQRRPVGYDRSLLDNYRPNQTFYLNDADWRARLREIGRTPFTQRPAGTYARDIMNRLLIDLSWASSRLEGNTYTRLDTLNLIEHSREAEGKHRLETQMILNHKRAIEFLIEQAEDIGFNLYTFMNLHALLSENLLADPAASGRLRERIVEISGTVYRPLAMPQQIEELFRIILEKGSAIHDPFEQAFFLMVHIPYLQPFEDVNKRVSRLAANIPFIKNNLCPLSFVDVPERAYVEGTLAIYEHARVDLLRDVFTWAYERSCEQFKAVAGTLPEPDPFRLKYRAELGEVVGETVRQGTAIDAAAVRLAATHLVPMEDVPRFVKMALTELRHLHEGNIARYRIRLAEYRAWKARQR
ncbi:MAG TPA: Fic family protein [Burkholderiales bacterium]|nr:Fic family protein [Burkholderiales bacterium]